MKRIINKERGAGTPLPTQANCKGVMLMQTIYSVYWVHNPSHTDPYTEGYVGFSNNPKRRLEEHAKGDFIVGRAIRKHKTILTILHTFKTKEEARNKEKHYRPNPSIGWNIAPGGQGGSMPGELNGMFRKSHSEETKLKMSKSHEGKEGTFGMIGKSHSEETKLKMSLNNVGMLGKSHSEESKLKMSLSHKGKHSEPKSKEHKEKIRISALNRPKFVCDHCGKECTKSNLVRWHGDNCKLK